MGWLNKNHKSISLRVHENSELYLPLLKRTFEVEFLKRTLVAENGQIRRLWWWISHLRLIVFTVLCLISSCNRAASAVDWNWFNTGSNPVPIATFAKYGRIDHFSQITDHIHFFYFLRVSNYHEDVYPTIRSLAAANLQEYVWTNTMYKLKFIVQTYTMYKFKLTAARNLHAGCLE